MMGRVQIATVLDTQTTAVSNIFIDEYLGEANDAEIKVYLHLLRTMQSGTSTNVTAIADKFNHTEKDVLRALEYWQHKGLIRLEHDKNGYLTNIFLEELIGGAPRPYGRRATDRKFGERPAETEELKNLMKLAETYFRRPLSHQEAKTIGYIHGELHFSTDLTDYLLQYCVEQTNNSPAIARYMEKTAIGWHRDGVTTVAKAKAAHSARYDKHVYSVMRALGLDNQPTATEAEYIMKWFREYAFDEQMVAEACRLTVLKTQKKRLLYCDGILKRWHEENVRTPDDVAKAEAAHEAVLNLPGGHGTKKKGVTVDTANRFNRFTQNDYNFDELKERIVSNR